MMEYGLKAFESDNECYGQRRIGVSSDQKGGADACRAEAIGSGIVQQSSRYLRTVPRVCRQCSGDFKSSPYAISIGRGQFCSRPCASRAAFARGRALNPRIGADNPNWRGGRSKRSYEYSKRFKAVNPEMARAHRAVFDAVSSGRLVRPTWCSVCAAGGRIEGHHEDYSLPLDVQWLCRPCHRIADKRRAALAGHAGGTLDTLQQPDRRSERNPRIDLLTEREAADACRYFDRGCLDPVRAFQRWARRSGIPVHKVGRARLYDPAVLRAFLAGETRPERHRAIRRPSSRLALVHGRESVARPNPVGSPQKVRP